MRGWDLDFPKWDWEWLLGGNWLARIGVLALVIGIGFFLKLAFDNQWIGETGRVLMGLAAGLALLGGGEFWRRKYPILAQPLTGGGLAVLYLSIFAAFSLYDLIPALWALGFFFLVTLTAAGLALRYESFAIAVLGILGGFITPVLLGERLPDQRVLLAYVLVLDLGVLALATFRNWQWFTLLGLIGSLGLYQFWLTELEPSLMLASVGLTAISLIFVGATTLFHLLWRRTPGPVDHALVLLNATAYFGLSYHLLFDEIRPWMGGFTALLALFYGLLGYGILMRHRERVHHSLLAIGIAIVFLTIAVPVQLSGPWICVAWAVEGVVLVWLSFLFGMPQLRWFGIAVFAVFGVWLLAIDTVEVLSTDLTPVLNLYTLPYVAAVAACFLAAYLIYRERDSLYEWEQYMLPGFLVAGSVFLTVSIPVQASGLWIPIAWAVEGLIMIAASFRLGLLELRLASLGVYGIMLVRLLAIDTVEALSTDLTPVLNLYTLAYAAAVAASFLAAFLAYRERDGLTQWEQRYLLPGFLVAGSVFLTISIPVQASGPWIPIAWAVEGLIMIAASFRLGLLELRLISLGVYGIMLVRLLAIDTPHALGADLTVFLNFYTLAYAAAVAACFLAAFLVYRERDRLPQWEQRYLLPAFLVAGVLSLTVAVPVQASGPWIPIAWSIEGLIMMAASFRLGLVELRLTSLGVYGVMLVRLLAVDTLNALNVDVPLFLNLYTLAYAADVSASFLAAFLVHRERDSLTQWEQQYLLPAFLVAGALSLIISIPVQASGPWVPIVWTVEGLIMITASFRLGMVELRLISLVVYGVVLVRLLGFETFDVDLATIRPVLNLRFLAFVVGVASLYLGTLAFWHWRRNYYDEMERYFLYSLLVAANFLTLWALSAEIIISTQSDYFFVPPAIAGDVASVSLSILWAVYAAILIVVGIARRSRWTRIGGLALLVVPVLKLFLVDSFALEQEYRVAAYLALGLVLVIGGFLYQRYSHTIREFLLE